MDKPSLETIEGLIFINDSVRQLRAILVHANAKLVQDDIDKYSVPVVLFDAARQSTEAFEVLVAHELFRDAFPIARAIFETVLNAAYILAPGSAAEIKAVRHAKQKVHRQITTTYDFKNAKFSIGWPSGVKFEPPPDFKKAVGEFTTKKGREITSWTPESISSRIEFVENWLGGAAGDSLRFEYESIYPLASEFSHGTLYSVIFWAAGTSFGGDDKSEAFVRRHRLSETAVLAIQVLSSLRIAIWAISKIVGDDSLRVQSKEVMDEMAKTLGLQPVDRQCKSDAS